MKNRYVILLIATVFALSFGCEPSMQKEEFIGVEEYHDTRVKIICEISGGRFTEKTIHRSQTAVCGTAVIKAEDYLSGKKKYGSLPGCEEKFNRYLISKKRGN